MFSKKREETVNNTAKPPPKPLLVDPSGTFDGNDGPWSTFFVNVGDDASGGGQTFKVHISTSSPITLVPVESGWCNDDCSAARGVQIFKGSQTRGLQTDNHGTWKEAGIYDYPKMYGWFNETSPRGRWGLDNVGLGQSDPSSMIITNQYVVGSSDKNFYMGYFGLAAGPIAPGAGKESVDPYLTTFTRGDNIPSISYGYTAGAKYRNNDNGYVGNLVLGGYDSNRVNFANGISIAMPNRQNTSLAVGVQSITYHPNRGVEANSFSITNVTKGFSAVIDSTLPYLWLPDSVCDNFAEFFNLEYDEDLELYTIDRSAAQNNDHSNATVSFKIGNGPTDSSNFTEIRLPYSAFDKIYFEPPNGNETRYFPIKKSPDGSFVLGRTFLQEAYLVVDYERRNFTVAPALFPDPEPQANLIPIYNTTYDPTPTLIPTGGGGGGGGLSGGAIAGIVVGILVAFLGAALGFFLWWKKRRAQKDAPPNYKEATEIDTSAAGAEVKHRRVSELDSQPPGSQKPPALGGFYGDNRDKTMSPFPAISEMDSPPAELYSPPAVAATPHSEGNSSADYFTAGGKLGRRGATRESSANNTPGTPPPITPVAELPGDDGGYQAGNQQFEMASPKVSPILKRSSLHNRGPSETASQSNIDEVMKRHSVEPSPERPAKDEPVTEGTANSDKKADTEDNTVGEVLERRPSHTRGLSDTTVQSDTTVVSQPTPEELERWALADDGQPRRPLSE